jgi:hypothetical protein
LFSSCTGKLPRCSRGCRCRPNDWIVSRWCWQHLRCAWWWQPLSCDLVRGQHLRSAITSLEVVVFLPQWPITRISLGCTRASLPAWCHVEWGRVVELISRWKW